MDLGRPYHLLSLFTLPSSVTEGRTGCPDDTDMRDGSRYIYVYFFSVMAKTTSRICGIEAFPISVPKTTVVDSGVKIPQK